MAQVVETKKSETLTVSSSAVSTDVPVDKREKFYDMLIQQMEDDEILDFVDIFETNAGFKIQEQYSKFSNTDLTINIRWMKDENTSKRDFTKNPTELSIFSMISYDDGESVKKNREKLDISNTNLSKICSIVCGEVKYVQSYS